MHRSVVSSNIRDPCTEVSGSCINLGYVALSEGVFMLRGSFCQSHVMFGDSLGKQCTAMSAAFIARCFIDSSETWTRPVLDEVLIHGDQLYKARSPFVEDPYLNADEVMGPLSIFNNVQLTLAIEPESLFQLQGVLTRDNLAQQLQINLRRLAELHYTNAILTINQYSMGIHVRGEHVLL
jgi:hypothetical protein